MPPATVQAPTGPQTDYRVEEVAALLRVSGSTVRRLVDRGHLAAYRVGKSVRIRAAAVDRLRCTPAASAPLT